MAKPAEILVVDDVPANLEVLTETLSSAGYTVAAVTTGERALRRLKSYLPDLILLDVQMPGIDGFETCQHIKSNLDTTDIPIIFITALSDSESIAKGFSLGAVDYITKPFRESEVLARVKTHLQLHHLTRDLEQQVKQRTLDLSAALQQLQSSQVQLVQSEKMAALGNLVAGVAHEINNPVGFISGNISAAREYLQDLLHAIALYQQHCPSLDRELADELADLDLDFITEDFPKVIASMQLGVQLIYEIGTSLRTFSRLDTDAQIEFNLHDGIESTLSILKYRLKANNKRPDIEIVRNYGDLPDVKCFPGQLNQVFMNLLANAIDALDESNASKTFTEIETAPNAITIRTELSEDKQSVLVGIADNGIGMSEDVKARIFEQGYTTKEVGKGTGLGMAIAQSIIEEKHGGQIICQTNLGQGTEFMISLPLS